MTNIQTTDDSITIDGITYCARDSSHATVLRRGTLLHVALLCTAPYHVQEYFKAHYRNIAEDDTLPATPLKDGYMIVGNFQYTPAHEGSVHVMNKSRLVSYHQSLVCCPNVVREFMQGTSSDPSTPRTPPMQMTAAAAQQEKLDG